MPACWFAHVETARAPEGLESYKLAEKPHQHPGEEDEEKLKVRTEAKVKTSAALSKQACSSILFYFLSFTFLHISYPIHPCMVSLLFTSS
jgi:hypothetical protein